TVARRVGGAAAVPPAGVLAGGMGHFGNVDRPGRGSGGGGRTLGCRGATGDRGGQDGGSEGGVKPGSGRRSQRWTPKVNSCPERAHMLTDRRRCKARSTLQCSMLPFFPVLPDAGS